MRIGLAADFHLDKRLGQRTDAAGINLRSLDLEAALGRVVDGMLRERCDVVCILGDLFDNAKPSERARQAMMSQLRRLAEGLPAEGRLVLLRGNHDAPSGFLAGTAVGTTALALPNVEVADEFETRIVEIEDVRLTLIPWMRSDEELIAAVSAARPEPGRHNLLLLHAGLADLAEFATLRPGSQTLTRALVPTDFDWIFSGHFHGHRTISDLRWTFVGSAERLSVAEAGQPKGFLVYDTDTSTFDFHPITTRSWYDLGSLDGREMSAPQVLAQLEKMTAGLPDYSEALVRARIDGLSPEAYAAIDQVRLAKLRSRAFYADIELRVRVPELLEALSAAAAHDEGDAPLLIDLEGGWNRFLDSRGDLKKSELVALRERGLAVLREAAG